MGSAGVGQEGPADGARSAPGGGCHHPHAGMASTRAGEEGPAGDAADYLDGRSCRPSENQGDPIAGQIGSAVADAASRKEKPEEVEESSAVAGRRVHRREGEVRRQGHLGHDAHRPAPNRLGGALSFVVDQGRQGRHVHGVDHRGTAAAEMAEAALHRRHIEGQKRGVGPSDLICGIYGGWGGGGGE